MNLLPYVPISWQRRYLLSRYKDSSAAGVMHEYLSMPLATTNTEIDALEFLVLDMETTGLSFKHDRVLSIGYTVIKERRIIMAENFYAIIKQSENKINENVEIHGLTESQCQNGLVIQSVLEKLLVALKGRVLVAHHAGIEVAFINKLCLANYGHSLPMQFIDTLLIEKKRQQRSGVILSQQDLRLFNLRKKYGLPRYGAHDALQDAIATAELLLLQVAHVCGQGKCQLKDL